MERARISDADLVAESLGGNRDAFGQIVERYQALITSLAYCATGNVSQSEDLAQETFLTAWKQLAELREPAKLRAWLCRIARFRISKEARRRDREPTHEARSLESVDEWASPEPLPRENAISDEEISLLWHALERIPSTYREPLVLFYREHQSVDAVARGLGLSEDAVKQRLSRGRKLLEEQVLVLLARALDQTRPGKSFSLGVMAALPVLATTATGGSIGTSLAKPGSVAAKASGSGGLLQAYAYLFMGTVYWVVAALPLGGYIGYKMGGDRQLTECSRQSVSTFWRLMGLSMLLLFGLPLLLALGADKVAHISSSRAMAWGVFYQNTCVPVFVFGVVPLLLVLWLWRRRLTGAGGGRLVSSPKPEAVLGWVLLTMAMAVAYLGFMGWICSRISPAHFPQTRYLSTSEIQNILSNSQVRKYRFRIYQSLGGARRLSGDLLQTGKVTPFVAPAQSNTVALLQEKGIPYDTTVESRPAFGRITYTAWWAQRLLNPFCCFILMAGAVTLWRGTRAGLCGQSGLRSLAALRRERRVDKAFASLAACAMVTLAVLRGVGTDWHVRSLSAFEVSAIAEQHKNARFEVFEYYNGSRKLWISEQHMPDYIAPATDTILEELTSRGIAYETYVAAVAGMPGPSRGGSMLWILMLVVGAGSLFWWVAASRPVTSVHSQSL